jgi:hypothetical protein
MDYAALTTSLIGTASTANTLLSTTTGIPAIVTGLIPLLVLGIGISVFKRLSGHFASRVG